MKPVGNRAYSTLNNNYEITFDMNSTIEEVADEGNIVTMNYNFVGIDTIENTDPGVTVGKSKSKSKMKGLFFYTVGILCNVECCIRYSDALLPYPITSLASHITTILIFDIYPIYHFKPSYKHVNMFS